MDDNDRFTVTVPEAGRALGLTRHGAYEAAKRGEIYTIRFGRLLRVPKAWLNNVLCNGPLPLERITKERSDGKRGNSNE
jgi:excisionase family DNA binding protein